MGSTRAWAAAILVTAALGISACGKEPTREAQLLPPKPPITGFTLTNRTTASTVPQGMQKRLSGVKVTATVLAPTATNPNATSDQVVTLVDAGQTGEQLFEAPAAISINYVVELKYEATDGSNTYTFTVRVADSGGIADHCVFLGGLGTITLEAYSPPAQGQTKGTFTGSGSWTVGGEFDTSSSTSKGLIFK